MSDRALVSTRKGLFTLQRKNGSWSVSEPAFAGVPVTQTLYDARDSMLYAALKHGHFGTKVHRSTDGGKTWSEAGAPAFPADAADGKALFQVWSLETGAAPGELWAGAIPAGLFHSTDHGDTWSLDEKLWNVPERAQWFGGGYDDAGIHSIVADPRQAGRMVVTISCGGVWETKDAGANWTVGGEGLIATYMPPERQRDSAIQDPHRVAACAAAPDIMWMQHHCGVYRSGDGGAHWSQLTPPVSGFGFAVAAHPKDSATAWFAPAVSDECRMAKDGQLCVNRTRDGGRTWETLRRGLPQQDAYDLIYRHGLDVDESGTRLIMGSTTGGLWTTDDSGDHWQALDVRMPPVYAVRFA